MNAMSRGRRKRAIASSVGERVVWGDGLRRMERRQPAATVARPKSCKQSRNSDSMRGIKGSWGGITWLLVVSMMVRDKSVFLAQGREVSDSRRWAIVRVWRRREMQPRI